MTVKALNALALCASMPSSGSSTGTVDIATMWGWHYLIDTDNGVRRRLLYRVSVDGIVQQHPSEFELADGIPSGFKPTASDLRIEEVD